MAEHTCPVWVGHLLASPLRKLLQRPESILKQHIEPGMTVLDAGCAMGFFSIPMARMVGPRGRIICVDLQERMLRALERRAQRAGVRERLETRACGPKSMNLVDLPGAIDFALAFAVVHEVADPERFLGDIHTALRPGGRLLMSEPTMHVSRELFAESLRLAQQRGFRLLGLQEIKRGRSALLEKPWD